MCKNVRIFVCRILNARVCFDLEEIHKILYFFYKKHKETVKNV